MPINESLMMFLGFFVAEGALSKRNGIRLAIGKRNQPLVPELRTAIKELFGIEPTYYVSKGIGADELRLLNSVVTAIFRLVFCFDGTESVRKHIPDLVFNVDHRFSSHFSVAISTATARSETTEPCCLAQVRDISESTHVSTACPRRRSFRYET